MSELVYFTCRACRRVNAVDEEALYASLDEDDRCNCLFCFAWNRPLDPVRASENESDDSDLIIDLK